MREHQSLGNRCVVCVHTTAKPGDYFISLGLVLRAQTVQKAGEDEYDNACESLRKTEMKELSVLAIFQQNLMILLCCVTHIGSHCS